MVQFFIMALLLFSASESFGQILNLTPSLSLSERYDDNIFQTSTDKETDFVTIVTPGIQLRYQPASDTLLELDYRTDFEFFAQNTEQNQIGQRGTLRFSSPITPFLSLTMSDSLIITEEPGDRFVEIDEVTGLRSISQENRGQTVRNRAVATLQALLSARSTLSLLFDSLIEDVENVSEVDEYRYTLGAELGYSTNVRRGSLVRLFYDATFHNFSANAPLLPGQSEQPNFQVHTFNVGYLHPFSPTLVGDASVGYAMTTSDAAAEDDHTAFVANLGLTKTLREGNISFRYRRSLTSGRGEGGSVLADTFTLAILTGLTSKITAGISSNLSFFDFQESEDEDRTFWTIRPKLSYQMLRFWQLSFDYDFSITNFDISTRADRTEHRLTFASQFTIRQALFLILTYRHRTRQFSEGFTDGDNDFTRNEVMLTVTYAPTFLFGR
jgi:hypothetical protein